MKKALDNIVGVLTIIFAVGMILSILIQILGRVILPKSPIWTEEASRYLFIYVISFGSALAIKYGDFVNVDTFIDRLKDKNKLLVQILNNTIVMVLMAVDALYAIEFIKLGSIQKSSAMLIPMNLIYLSTIILPVLVLIYLIQEQYEIIMKLKGK